MAYDKQTSHNRRLRLIWIILIVALLVIIGKFAYLKTVKRQFLTHQSALHSLHHRTVPTVRGDILSRNGMPLAVSAPMYNVIFDPKIMHKYATKAQLKALTQLPAIDLSYLQLKKLFKAYPYSQYYLARKAITPAASAPIKSLKIPGITLKLNWRRFYPLSNAAAQLVGFTNIHGQGQDGLELSYDQQLMHYNGQETVLTNAKGQTLKVLHVEQKPRAGRDITLSIDSRIQNFVYSALKTEVKKSHAISGSAVVLDPRTGEILATGSYPSFNPNSFSGRVGPQVRARALTDMFEPGSVMKVLTVAAALESGKYTPKSVVNTSPGYYYINGNRIRDDADFGVITMTGVITKSSNVGISKIALTLNRQKVYNMFVKAGVGSKPSGIFPGEASGILHPFNTMGEFEFATMTFGYAITVSLVQLARIYGAIANQGVLEPISFLKIKKPPPGRRLMSPKTARTLIKILHTVVGPGGTGLMANVPGFCVAGKTGTTHQVGPQGFYKHRYNAVFVGMIPCSHPKLVIAVRMNDPTGMYNEFGGVSAAPVFAQVAQKSLLALGIKPDRPHINHKLFSHEKNFASMIAGA